MGAAKVRTPHTPSSTLSLNVLKRRGFFNQAFDDHFRVNSSRVQTNLLIMDEELIHKYGPSPKSDARYPGIAAHAEYWGLRVDFIVKLWDFIAEDILGYAATHRRDENHRHVCLL